ncbi:YqaA family protein [Psychromonas sp. MB-3u-54]|uniref:YqaA family protein n=1 Tax=Psychromonas sp. MB-3u-54 TaxID=2058319 RepID=UPI001E5BC240|nr:DedA family protein [Psychromonas sp. MB-3u-54]
MWSELMVLLVSSFVSATLFPGGSELLLIYYVKNNPSDLWWYFSAVTLGNSLGALSSYFLGFYVCGGMQQAKSKYLKTWVFCQKYGLWALLLSWLPVVGDFIPLAAGWLKLPIFRSILLITLGKALRYAVITLATLSLI